MSEEPKLPQSMEEVIAEAIADSIKSRDKREKRKQEAAALAKNGGPVLVARDGESVNRLDPYVDLTEIDGPVSYLLARLGLTDGKGPPHMIAGAGGRGKTVFCQDLLLCLAARLSPFPGLKPRKAFRCVHVDLEQGKRTTRRRYQRLAYARGIDLGALGHELQFAYQPQLRLVPEARNAWLRFMRDRDLILIDSLRVAMAGIEENSSDARAPIDFLTGLSDETGCRALLAHHLRKSTLDGRPTGIEDLRGSSAIPESCDAIWLLAGEERSVLATNGRPSRDHGEKAAPITFSVVDVSREHDPKWGLKLKYASATVFEAERKSDAALRVKQDDAGAVDEFLAFLADNPGTTTELSLLLHWGKEKVMRAILHAGQRVSVVVERTGDRGQPRKVYVRSG